MSNLSDIIRTMEEIAERERVELEVKYCDKDGLDYYRASLERAPRESVLRFINSYLRLGRHMLINTYQDENTITLFEHHDKRPDERDEWVRLHARYGRGS